ncbi:MAG: phosphoserine phosphatase SerB [Rhizobiaceae bacterium]
MFVATLIANPASPVLTARLVGEAAAAIGSKSVYWLADGIAADLLFTGDAHKARLQVEQATKGARIDIVIQAQEGRRKKVLIADMDSTMIGQECIDELADMVGLKAHVSSITARAMNGEIPFESALRERVALLKGLDANVVSKVIAERITLTPGGRELIATMKKNGGYTALVSGGFTSFTGPIAAMLGFDENQANVLDVTGGAFSGTVRDPILGRQAKADALQAMCARLGVTCEEAMAVGDGANDLSMIQMAGSGVALHAKPSVAAEARHRIDHGDLTALLYMQGYRKTDFVT